MVVEIEVRTKSYDEDSIHIVKAMANIASLCTTPYGYKIGEPEAKFGWSFYTIQINDELYSKMTAEFDDMIRKCPGRGDNDKFMEFMRRYFDVRGANVNLKLIGY